MFRVRKKYILIIILNPPLQTSSSLQTSSPDGYKTVVTLTLDPTRTDPIHACHARCPAPALLSPRAPSLVCRRLVDLPHAPRPLAPWPCRPCGLVRVRINKHAWPMARRQKPPAGVNMRAAVVPCRPGTSTTSLSLHPSSLLRPLVIAAWVLARLPVTGRQALAG